uniref:KRAB domain-containing protein n=1 Tax=Oryctolagus cuniculus TaxID=9986 RepID=A0A5F9D6A2_RABIT
MAHRTLYCDVMLENLRTLISLGFPVTKTKVIFKVEQGQKNPMDALNVTKPSTGSPISCNIT